MAIRREAIYATLFARLESKLRAAAAESGRTAATKIDIKTFSRSYFDFDKFSDQQMPALLLVAGACTPEHSPHGIVDNWTLGAMVVVYAKRKAGAPSPESVLLTIADEVEAALELSRTESSGWAQGAQTTLGGLVRQVRIGGSIQIDQADLGGDQFALTIPIEMLVTPQ